MNIENRMADDSQWSDEQGTLPLPKCPYTDWDEDEAREIEMEIKEWEDEQ